MKLIGSMVEREYREQLIYGKGLLENDSKYIAIREKIIEKHPESKSMFILHHIPDQGFEIFNILVDGKIVVEIERDLELLLIKVVNTMSLKEYSKNLSKTKRIKIAVALDLEK